MRTRTRRPSWSDESVELNKDDELAQHGIGCATLQTLDSPSGAPSFTPGSLLADLQAQLVAASVSGAPLVPIVQDREYPEVIPVDLNWRDHPRWKPLITTPSRTPNQDDPLVPDRSPTPSAWSNCSDVEDDVDASPGSFIHRRRRKEYVHRAPVWAVSGRDDGMLQSDDTFMGGQKAQTIRQSTTLPNLGPSDEYLRCISAQEQLMSGSNIPNSFDQTLEVQPVFTTTPNWPLSKDIYQDLPTPAGGITLRPRSLSKNADISVLDLNLAPSPGDSTSQKSFKACWSPNRNSLDSHNRRMGGLGTGLQPEQPRDAIPVSESYDDLHSITSTKIVPGSLVVCLCPFSPVRGDEFEMGFGDMFTVLKVFDDGWALCVELSGLEPSVEQILNHQVEVGPPKYVAQPDALESDTELPSPILGLSRGEPTQTSDSITTYQDTVTIITKRTFPVALSPKTKFLPLFAVTLLCNFGNVIRSGTCRFGTAPTLTPGGNLQPGEVALVIGDAKTPDRTSSLRFSARNQTDRILVDRQPTSSRTRGAKFVRPAATKVKSEPLPVRTKSDPLSDSSGKALARSRSSGDIRSTKSVKATLKRSFGTLRRKFTQAGDTKSNALRMSEHMVEPAVGPMAESAVKHMDKLVSKPVLGPGPRPGSDLSLDRAAQEKNEEMTRRADARVALEKGKRQETLERILPARDPAQDKKPAGLIPKISFSGFSLPGFSFSGFS
ncbi:hypothetical protein FGG08_003346 [Glutinoglossum americanum]|uniref:SH3 domain-containing protein n=1 Tax=Glutinoglossum americanum TaxID=1670608 RepID=A0A9P8HYG2_9PEZI|nr:hypothetical protein FGG08_003346 [Glutinoglossum americanum]